MRLALEALSLIAALAAASFMLGLGIRERRPALVGLGALIASLGLFVLASAAHRTAGAWPAASGAATLSLASSVAGGLLYLGAAPVFYRVVFGLPRSRRGELAYAAVFGAAFGAGLALIPGAVAGGLGGDGGGSGSVLALDALLFAEIAVGIGMGLASLRSPRDPLPRRFLRRFFLVSAAFFPFMAADALGSALGWAWIAAFDDLTLPAFLLVLAALVLVEGGRWARPLPSEASTLAAENALPEDAEAEPLPEANPQSESGSAIPQEATPVNDPWSLFTPREAEIARRLLSGESSKEIGAALGISAKTAENHTYRVFRKVGARSRLQLYRILGPVSPIGARPE
jgi:DNA-binding HTH domain-containing proteins